MKIILGSIALAALVPAGTASACAPPPPGWVQPTELQLLESHVSNASDIVYGIITEVQSGGRARFNVVHVYKGTLTKGETVETTTGWDFPVPYCAGMAGPPKAKPVGTYGVATFRGGSPELSFIPPAHVQTMIEKGWIKSARAR